MSSSIQAVNLQDLRAQNERASAVVGAFSILESYPAAKLQRLLRYHRPDQVVGQDVQRRASFDHLLVYFGLMEVASIADYVPSRLPADYVKFALSTLENPAVKLYYERNYPLLLPQLHRERLRGRWTKRESGSDLPALFIAFSEISKGIDEDLDIDSFLWFLEDGSIGDQSLEDLLDIIGDPEAFASVMLEGSPQSSSGNEIWEAVSSESALRDPVGFLNRFRQPERELDPAQSALHGFRKFLFLCRDFHRLLESAAGYPLTQSAMWHQHAYWFDQMRDDLRPYLRTAIDRFAAWQTETLDVDRAPREAAATELRVAVDALTSQRYGLALRTAYENLRPVTPPTPAEGFFSTGPSILPPSSISATSLPIRLRSRRVAAAKKRPAAKKAARRKQRPLAKKAAKSYAASSRKKSLAKKKATKRHAATKKTHLKKKMSRKKMSR